MASLRKAANQFQAPAWPGPKQRRRSCSELTCCGPCGDASESSRSESSPSCWYLTHFFFRLYGTRHVTKKISIGPTRAINNFSRQSIKNQAGSADISSVNIHFEPRRGFSSRYRATLIVDQKWRAEIFFTDLMMRSTQRATGRAHKRGMLN